MSWFFLMVRVIRGAYKALRAAVGIMIVAHGASVWIQNKKQGRVQRRAA